MIQIQNVTHYFGVQRADSETAVLKDVNLSVKRGEFLSVVGPTGCGKSTLLNVIAGLTKPKRGAVTMAGRIVESVRDECGYLFQSDTLLPWRTVFKNVSLGLEFRNIPKDIIKDRVTAWLKKVNLEQHSRKYPHELSGGMRKRTALAQTLITEPDVLLMDEPFSALDVQTRNLMENLLLDLWSKDQKTVVFVTHDLEEAISLSDRVVVFGSGPNSGPVQEFAIDLARPRDVFEAKLSEDFVRVQREIWETLKLEVEISQRNKAL